MTGTTAPPRVLHIHFGKEGGAERFFVNLADALAKRGVEQRFVIRPGRSWGDAIAAHGPVLHSNGRRTSPGGLWLAWRLRRLVKRWRPDAIMAWMPRAASFLPDHDGAVRFVRLGDFPANLKHFGRCDAVVGNTPEVTRVVRDLGWDRPALTITNFARPIVPHPVARAALDTPEDAFVICGAGRFVPRKGMDLLVAAAARVPDAWLWLVGDGRERERLEAHVREVGLSARARFVGWVDEPIHHIASADILVVPSRVEPLGNVALEGWQAGVPVVSTRSEGPSWFIRDRVDGRLVDIDDLDGLVEAIESVRADPEAARTMVQGGRERLAAMFGEDAIVDRYLALFRGDLSDRTAG